MAEPLEKHQKMRFDNTITLGNILTTIGMAVMGGAAWVNMSERVTRTEQAQIILREADFRHESDLRTIKSENRELMLEIKADIKELRNDIKKK